jgi:hypothetical protein
MRRVNPTSAPPSPQTVSVASLTGFERCGRLGAIWAGDASPAWFSAVRHVGSPRAVPPRAFSAGKRPPGAQSVSVVTVTRLKRCGKLEVAGQEGFSCFGLSGTAVERGVEAESARGK